MAGRWLFFASVLVPPRIVSIGIVLMGIVGCSETNVSNKPLDPTQVKLLKVNTAYSQYTGQNGRPPRGPKEIRSLLAPMGDPDDLLNPGGDGRRGDCRGLRSLSCSW